MLPSASEHRLLQDCIDAMYMDKLDGRIDNEFLDRKAAESRSEQSHLKRDIQRIRTRI